MAAIIIVAAMSVVLVLILGVGTALRQQKAVDRHPVAVMQDFATTDLNDRLSKITLSSPGVSRQVVIAPLEDDDPLAEYQQSAAPRLMKPLADTNAPTGLAARVVDAGAAGLGSLSDRGWDAHESEPRRPLPPSAGSSTSRLPRLALPAIGEPQSSPNRQPAPASAGSEPLAARFSGRDLPPETTASPSAPGQRLGLPGRVAAEPVHSGFAIPRADPSPANPVERPSLPGKVAGGFSMSPVSSNGPAAVPFAQATPALPGTVSDSVPDNSRRTLKDGNNAPALDIRAILRGESVPRGLPGTVAAGAGSMQPKPQYTTGPLPPLRDPSGPLGAVPFDPSLLLVKTPNSAAGEAPAAAAFSRPWSGSMPDFGPIGYPDSAERVPAEHQGPDLDATRVVDDFDLPDAGFETHVFSTAELIDGEQFDALSLGLADSESTIPLDALVGDTTEQLPDIDAELALSGSTALPHGMRSYDAPEMPSRELLPEQPGPALNMEEKLRSIIQFAPTGTGNATRKPDSGVPSAGGLRDVSLHGSAKAAGAQQASVSPLQMTRAHDIVRELANQSGVVFVKLVGPDGSALLSQGAENGDFALDDGIATIMRVAAGATGSQRLGEPNYLSLESEKAALLVVPVQAGVGLAVYLNNPARLGLLRRQVRKPVSSLRALLQDSGSR